MKTIFLQKLRFLKNKFLKWWSPKNIHGDFVSTEPFCIFTEQSITEKIHSQNSQKKVLTKMTFLMHSIIDVTSLQNQAIFEKITPNLRNLNLKSQNENKIKEPIIVAQKTMLR